MEVSLLNSCVFLLVHPEEYCLLPHKGFIFVCVFPSFAISIVCVFRTHGIKYQTVLISSILGVTVRQLIETTSVKANFVS